jgi:hypothetical protein
MSDLGVQAVQPVPPLTEIQRVTNTFIAPSRTFEDIQRGNKSWWLPFVIVALVGYIFFAAVYTKVGMATVSENQIKLNPKAEERLAQATPEQRETQMKISVTVTEIIFAINPLLILGGIALMSLVLLGTVNFIFGGKATFGGIFSVWIFALLPGILKALLGALVLFMGAPPEQFNIKNYAPTNLAAFVFPNAAEANQALYSLFSSLDIITIWTLVLLSIGVATVAKVKRTSGYIAVFGWWALLVLVGVGWAAAFS